MKANTLPPAPRAETETFIVAKTDEGYRVCSPMNPATQYVVKDTGDDMICTCPEFAANSQNPDWCCGHIRAVHKFMDGQNGRSNATSPATAHGNGASSAKGTPEPNKTSRASHASMCIKRSVSPDGHVDSLSVEFSLPVGKLSSDEIKQHADRALKLQSEITHQFLGTQSATRPAQSNSGSQRNGRNGRANGVPAQLMNIEAMDTRKGRSLFINVFVERQVAKLFGDEQKLAEALMAAGYGDQAEQIEEGMELNLPCRAITQRNGRYLNIERLLPATNGGAS